MFQGLLTNVWCWALAATLAMLAAVGAQDYARGKNLAVRTAERDALQARVDAAVQSSEINQATIAALRDANAANAAAAATDKLRADGAFAALAESNARLQSAELASRRRNEVIYEQHDDVRAWGDQPVPPALATELRHRTDL